MTAAPTSVAALLARLEETHKATGGQQWSATVPGMVHADPSGRTKSRYVATVEHPADAAAIVAEHNATPALIAAVRGVLALADDLDSYVAARGKPATGTYDDGLNRAQAATAADLRTAVAAVLGAEVTGR